jgi:hypothetical protein
VKYAVSSAKANALKKTKCLCPDVIFLVVHAQTHKTRGSLLPCSD